MTDLPTVARVERILDAALEHSPIFEGREVYVPLTLLRDVVAELNTTREWFWHIVDREGVADLPSDEELALEIMLNVFRNLPGDERDWARSVGVRA